MGSCNLLQDSSSNEGSKAGILQFCAKRHDHKCVRARVTVYIFAVATDLGIVCYAYERREIRI